jgi:hypothetical protein
MKGGREGLCHRSDKSALFFMGITTKDKVQEPMKRA